MPQGFSAPVLPAEPAKSARIVRLGRIRRGGGRRAKTGVREGTPTDKNLRDGEETVDTELGLPGQSRGWVRGRWEGDPRQRLPDGNTIVM